MIIVSLIVALLAAPFGPPSPIKGDPVGLTPVSIVSNVDSDTAAGTARGDIGLHACHTNVLAGNLFRWDPAYGVYYYATIQRTVPSNSTCNDINVGGLTRYSPPQEAVCMWARVRFYPSGGGEQTTNWKWTCNSPQSVIAYGVLNGTVYRFEAYAPGGIATYPYYVRLID